MPKRKSVKEDRCQCYLFLQKTFHLPSSCLTIVCTQERQQVAEMAHFFTYLFRPFDEMLGTLTRNKMRSTRILTVFLGLHFNE